MTDVDAIIQKVAAADPLYESAAGDPVCVFCAGHVRGPKIVSRDPIKWGPHDVENHDPECAWRLAVERVGQ